MGRLSSSDASRHVCESIAIATRSEYRRSGGAWRWRPVWAAVDVHAVGDRSDGEGQDGANPLNQIVNRFRAWSACDECGFEGLLDFECRSDENYADAGLLGVMLDAACPACETRGAVFVASEYFDEMQADARRRINENEQD